jgi:hypothetical protein
MQAQPMQAQPMQSYPMPAQPMQSYPMPAQPMLARPMLAVVPSRSDAPAAAARPVYRRPLFILAVFGALAATVAVLLLVLWPTRTPIESEARVNEQGKEVLRLTCDTCPDGTVMTVDGERGTTAAGVTEIELQRSLIVGQNTLTVGIDRPAAGRDEQVQLVVPVAYRLRPDLAALTGDAPKFHVEVEAKPETTVLVDNKPMSLGVDGKGRYEVDVSAECAGQKAETDVIDRKIAYTIQPRGAAPSTGFVSLRVGITPLTLQSPRPETVVDNRHFLVAGRTMRGAVVEIEDSKFAAGVDGTFSRKLQIRQVGETIVRVRATLPEHAPRTAVFRVKRVDDLAAEGKAFAADTKLEAKALMRDVQAHKGDKVVLEGEVVEVRTTGFEHIVLLDVVRACAKPPCLARLVYAGSEPPERGQTIRVFGHVVGAVQSGARLAPEIDVAFLLKRRKR